jgi:bifunctional non-homologous end joining protein LigD
MPRRRQSYEPELATLVGQPPRGDEWLHEIKLDGYRIGAVVENGRVTLVSRNGKDWTDRFPTLVETLAKLDAKSAILDGEVVVLLPDGRTSFQKLQNAFAVGPARDVHYFVFDLLAQNGDDVGARPLEERKKRLAAIVRGLKHDRIRYSDHTVGDGERVLSEACRLGLEGIISKRRDLPHKDGRTKTWLKTKCIHEQEFVIGGFTDPEGVRDGIGALLVGVRDEAGKLVFAGKVGTGFTQQSARELRAKLEVIERKESPFATRPAGWLGKNAHWVTPKLVAEVKFSEWTSDGKLRHPSFRGLREDKPASEVVRETPEHGAPAKPGAAVVAGVRISHPERVLYPEIGLTKLALAELYEAIARWMLPHVVGRPLTLVRCPDGLRGECFFMKHSKLWAPKELRRVKIREKKKIGDYLVIESAAAIVALVQMNVLEIHTWNATVDHLECPDRMIFDLDPGPHVEWPDVVAAARLVRTTLRKLRLESFVKTTGGSGLHVVVPIVPAARWEDCLAFSRVVSESIAAGDPERYTTRFARAGREQRILIDYLRNNRTNTAVAAYSTRAKPSAPVSVPLRWEELSPRTRPSSFTATTLPRRLANLRADPWQDYWKLRQRIDPAAWRKAEHA